MTCLTQSFQSKQLKNDDHLGRHLELWYVFAMSEVRVHSYVSYSQPLESTKNFSMQYSLRYLRTFERVVIALGLFRSSLFISGLTLFGLWNHQHWEKAYVHASIMPSQLFEFLLDWTIIRPGCRTMLDRPFVMLLILFI